MQVCSKFSGPQREKQQERGRGVSGSGVEASSPLLTSPPANTYLTFHDLISSAHNCQAVQVWASTDAPEFDAIPQFYLVQLSL